jgi:hypothetical protein
MGRDKNKNVLDGQRRGTMTARQAMAVISMAKKVSSFDYGAGCGSGKFYE